MPGGQILRELVRRRATPDQTPPVPDWPVPDWPVPAPPAPPSAPTPYVVARLAAWRLLHDLPFAYLVPDAAMLPPESIRFFHLDAGWLDALCDAALGLGADPQTWAARAPAALPVARPAVTKAMPWVRELRRGRIVLGTRTAPWPPDWDDLPKDPPPGVPQAPPPVTGFLLRSALVSGWPGTQVRAWSTAAVPLGADPTEYAADHPDHVVPLLRVQRLSPAVLIVLFAGVPQLVWLEEPHHGVQLGVDVVYDKPIDNGPIDTVPIDTVPVDARRVSGKHYTVPVRDEAGNPTGQTVPVPMRIAPFPGGVVVDGVIDVAGLAAALDVARPLAEPRGSAAMGLALLQPPARQRFAGTAEERVR